MYKKFMLGLLLLPIFSGSESLHAFDPVTDCCVYVAVKTVENGFYVCVQVVKYCAKHPDEVATAISTVKGLGSLAVTTVVNRSAADLYDKTFPKEGDEANKAEAEVRTCEAKKRKDFLDAEANFSTCLKKLKKDCPKNAVGVPTVCEDFARALILCDGDYRVAEMMTNFNK